MSLLKIYEKKELTPGLRKKLLQRESALDQSAFEIAAKIIEDVEKRREDAVLEYTEKFDGVRLKSLLAAPEEFAAGEKSLDEDLKGAFRQAAENIAEFHRIQKDSLQDREITRRGTRLGIRYLPVDQAGVYVPGGKAAYPSSVLMGVIPARIAGIEEPLILTPPDKTGSVLPAVLFAASLAGTGRILKSGGAQGIAAAAFGLGGKPAQVIVGPGNRFVTAAKSLLTSRGLIRMDMPAGPSEVLVIADDSANAVFVASDMLSQAEHGEDSPAILVTTSRKLAEAVDRELERGIAERPARAEMKRTSIEKESCAIVFDSLAECIDFSNEYGPEHLEICTSDPERDLAEITSAGSIFVGHYAPVALGDYYSGTNHVLPTGGSAGAYSGLGVDTFMKRLTWQYPTKESLGDAKEAILRMSISEGLDQEHGHSVAVRFE